MFMSWYVQHFRIPASHGIYGFHLFTNLHMLLRWFACGMEAATLLSEGQQCSLKLSRLHHNLDVVLNLCTPSFIRLATLCFLNKHLLIRICGHSLHDKQHISFIQLIVPHSRRIETSTIPLQKLKTSPRTN
jgi:hypothetical protein